LFGSINHFATPIQDASQMKQRKMIFAKTKTKQKADSHTQFLTFAEETRKCALKIQTVF